MQRLLKSYLTHPCARELNIDSPEAVTTRKRIIEEKPFLRTVYKGWYTSIVQFLPINIAGPVLELGSGAGFLKSYIPKLISSEILKVTSVDVILDGQCLPFKPAALRAIVMIDVFHHIPCVQSFLADAAVCVKPGGGIIMIEPWITPWSRFVYRHLHHEPFQPNAIGWNLPEGGPVSQSNSALPWIVFERDRGAFEKWFPEWQLKDIGLHTPFSYLGSGGVSLRTLMPGPLSRICQWLEKILRPWMHFWAMFATIWLERRNSDGSHREDVMRSPR